MEYLTRIITMNKFETPHHLYNHQQSYSRVQNSHPSSCKGYSLREAGPGEGQGLLPSGFMILLFGAPWSGAPHDQHLWSNQHFDEEQPASLSKWQHTSSMTL